MRFVVGRAKFSGRSITVSVVCTDNKICCFLGFQQFLNKSIRIGQMLDYTRTNNQLCTENCFHAFIREGKPGFVWVLFFKPVCCQLHSCFGYILKIYQQLKSRAIAHIKNTFQSFITIKFRANVYTSFWYSSVLPSSMKKDTLLRCR